MLLLVGTTARGSSCKYSTPANHLVVAMSHIRPNTDAISPKAVASRRRERSTENAE